MTKKQKRVLVITGIVVGIILHISFCEWIGRPADSEGLLIKLYSYSKEETDIEGKLPSQFVPGKEGRQGAEEKVNIRSVKYNFGIYSKSSHTRSVLLGLILPILVLSATAFFYFSKDTG